MTVALIGSVVRPSSRALLRGMLRRLAAAGVVAGCLMMGLALLLPQDLARGGTVYLALCTVVFFVHVFWFHIGVAMAVAAGGLMFLRQWRLSALALLLALIGLAPTVSAMFSSLTRPTVAPAGTHVRVMSMNLFYFNTDRERIVRQIEQANPDVLLFVEYTPLHDQIMRQTITSEFSYRSVVVRHGRSGIGIYSRYPFLEEPDDVHLVSEMGTQMRGVLDIDGQPVALYGVHLASMRPSIRWINMNRRQTAALTQRLTHETIPVIVAGDFNFTERTANAQALRDTGLRSSHALAGSGRGSTWPQLPVLRWLPGVRIDEIYVSSEIACTGAWVGGYSGSDHLPVIADLVVPAPSAPITKVYND